jgi:hypothetical protein
MKKLSYPFAALSLDNRFGLHLCQLAGLEDKR